MYTDGKEWILETCVDSVRSALAAKRGGADRLELCANLIIGGTTPQRGLLELVRDMTGLPVRVLVRPRFGDFCYDSYEKEQILRDVRQFRDMEIQGIVVGALKPNGDLDMEFMKQCMREAGDMAVTCHRAFDMCRNWEETLEQLIGLGVDTVLTSGQESNAVKGAVRLKRMAEKAKGRIHILAGGGISSGSIRRLAEMAGICQFHMSGKREKDSPMEYRNTRISMGIKGCSEYILWETDEEAVKAAKTELLRMKEL